MSEVVRARRANDLPLPGRDARSVRRRVVTSPWTWVTVAAVLVFAVALYVQYVMQTANRVVPGGVNPGVSPAAIREAAGYALPTLLFWIVLFLVVDRFRPQRPVVWFLALGWGVAVATLIALVVNTWAAVHLAIVGNGDPVTGVRAAVFVAPFVEEACKATVLFWLAILVRYRLVSQTSLVALGGLSAAGFAFTENIQYYASAITYASQNIDVGNVQDVVRQQVLMRGVVTAFGHPLFTIMTALGLAIALRTRSKVVRVLAPLVGYLLAAGLHMVFNSQVSLNQNEAALIALYVFIALPLVLTVAVYVFARELMQGQLIRARLDDYVRMGWLRPGDPEVFSRLLLRLRALFIAATRGWRCWLATDQLQCAMTELACLRDAEARGIVDAAARGRAVELLADIREKRPRAVVDPRGQHARLPSLRRRRARAPRPAMEGGMPTGAPGSRYSAVNPTWGPPPPE